MGVGVKSEVIRVVQHIRQWHEHCRVCQADRCPRPGPWVPGLLSEESQVDCPVQRVCYEINPVSTHKWKLDNQQLVKFILKVTSTEEHQKKKKAL